MTQKTSIEHSVRTELRIDWCWEKESAESRKVRGEESLQ
jgi:hypothetical protein